MIGLLGGDLLLDTTAKNKILSIVAKKPVCSYWD